MADDAPDAPELPDVPKNLFITTRPTDEFGPAGHFVELSPKDAKAAGDAVETPTPEQLALR